MMRSSSAQRNGAKGIGRAELAAAQRACSAHFTMARIFSGLIALLYIAPTIYMMQVYDRVLNTGGEMTLVFISIALAVALITHGYLDSIRQRLLARASLRLDRVLGERLIRQSFEAGTAGEVRNTQILRDFDVYRQSLQGAAATAALDLPFAPLFIAVSFALHVWLGALILAGAALLIGLAILGERAGQRFAADMSNKAPTLYATAEAGQAYGGAVRALGMRGVMARRLERERDQLNTLGTRNSFLAMRYSGLIRLLRMALQSASLGLGAYLAIHQQITAGSLIAASVLSGRALAPIDQIVGAWRHIGQARTAKKSLIAFLDRAPIVRARMELPSPSGAVSIEGVSARAGAGEQYALQQVSFELPAGVILGVIGASGAGKSTLARIMVGAQSPDGGVVRWDGSSIADWDGDRLGAHTGYLPQETALFAGTIGENISRFDEAPGAAERVVKAAQAAGVHELVQRLPQGYDHALGARGAGLSAGQSQRIALARALYGAPRIIVLDEPNAHLDAEGDASLAATLTNAKDRGATVIIMTHRSGILSAADRLMVLREGRIDQYGPREEVLAILRKSALQSGQIRAMPAAGAGS